MDRTPRTTRIQQRIAVLTATIKREDARQLAAWTASALDRRTRESISEGCQRRMDSAHSEIAHLSALPKHGIRRSEARWSLFYKLDARELALALGVSA